MSGLLHKSLSIDHSIPLAVLVEELLDLSDQGLRQL